jgi:hypothetical protein
VCGPTPIASVSAPAHSVTGGQNLSVNDRAAPVEVAILPGKYTLHQAFTVAAEQAFTPLCCKTASAEFAPDPALNPVWIDYWERFHGAIKGNFGFQVILRVEPASDVPAAKSIPTIPQK